MAEATDGKETDEIVEREDKIFELAIHYVQNSSYPPGLSRDKKRAVRKRAAAVVCDKGEVFVQRKLRRVKVMTSTDECERILKKCLFRNRLECFPESRRRRLGRHRLVATKPVDVFCKCRLTWSRVHNQLNQLGYLIPCDI